MNMPVYDFVMSKLEATKGRWGQVARGSGVSRRTLEKIARKEIQDPRVSTVQRLADYFQSANDQ